MGIVQSIELQSSIGIQWGHKQGRTKAIVVEPLAKFRLPSVRQRTELPVPAIHMLGRWHSRDYKHAKQMRAMYQQTLSSSEGLKVFWTLHFEGVNG